MKKFMIIFLSICFLGGCSKQENDASYPKYFAPIVHEIETQETFYTMNTWQESSIGVGAYKDKVFTAYIDGEYYPFDLKEELTAAEEWNWMAVGIFHRDEEENTYICLNDFNFHAYGEEVEERNPQLLLIEFSTNHPEDYQVTPYTVDPYGAFVWVDGNGYRIGNSIYFNTANIPINNLGMIDLDTKEFYYCAEEYSVTNEYADKFANEEFGGFPYIGWYFGATLEQDDVIVYSATISEDLAAYPVGIVSVAFRDHVPIAYMSIDLTMDEVASGVKIEVVE